MSQSPHNESSFPEHSPLSTTEQEINEIERIPVFGNYRRWGLAGSLEEVHDDLRKDSGLRTSFLRVLKELATEGYVEINDLKLRADIIAQLDDFGKITTPPQADYDPGFYEEVEEPDKEGRFFISKTPMKSGGMAEIFIGWDRRMGRAIAAKKVKKNPNLTPQQEAKEQRDFEIEAKTQARAEGSSVPIYHYLVTPDGQAWMIMSLVNAERDEFLNTVLKENSQLSPERAADIVLGLAHKIDLHEEQHFAQSDIKPANIVISKDPVNADPRFIDFGVSVWEGQVKEELTGTVPYMAPERFSNEEYNLLRAEIFSLGIVAYEMIAGEKLFPGKDMIQVANRIINDEFTLKHHPALRALCIRSGISEDEMEKIFKKVLAKDPYERYDTATEFAQAFRDLIASRQTS
jgi:serine/threonine protein kinase